MKKDIWPLHEYLSRSGGPAFPVKITHSEPDNISREYIGMTLRDYFAAKAMQANLSAERTQQWLVEGKNLIEQFEKIAMGSYLVADAMLKVKDQVKDHE
jgi:hypothetical protein